MSQWSKHPPLRPCTAFFRGIRHTRNQQNMWIEDLVQIRWVEIARTKTLGVAMFGKARVYQLSSFNGLWKGLDVEVDDAA